jgi:hypothetical protein
VLFELQQHELVSMKKMFQKPADTNIVVFVNTSGGCVNHASVMLLVLVTRGMMSLVKPEANTTGTNSCTSDEATAEAFRWSLYA